MDENFRPVYRKLLRQGRRAHRWRHIHYLVARMKGECRQCGTHKPWHKMDCSNQ